MILVLQAAQAADSSWSLVLSLVAVISVLAKIILDLVKEKRNGSNGSHANQKWNHGHAKTLGEHETQIALMRQTLESHGADIRDTRRRLHDLSNDMTKVLMKLELE